MAHMFAKHETAIPTHRLFPHRANFRSRRQAGPIACKRIHIQFDIFHSTYRFCILYHCLSGLFVSSFVYLLQVSEPHTTRKCNCRADSSPTHSCFEKIFFFNWCQTYSFCMANSTTRDCRHTNAMVITKQINIRANLGGMKK